MSLSMATLVFRVVVVVGFSRNCSHSNRLILLWLRVFGDLFDCFDDAAAVVVVADFG